MIIGAGAAGQVILKELKSSDLVDAKACCIIDDNQNKWGRYMLGIPVVGGRDSILEAVEKYEIDQILFAIPTASPEEKRDILNICQETNKESSGCIPACKRSGIFKQAEAGRSRRPLRT